LETAIGCLTYRVMHFSKKGQIIDGGRHNYDHNTQIPQGRVRVNFREEQEAQNGRVKILTPVYRSYNTFKVEGDASYLKIGKRLQITSMGGVAYGLIKSIDKNDILMKMDYDRKLPEHLVSIDYSELKLLRTAEHGWKKVYSEDAAAIQTAFVCEKNICHEFHILEDDTVVICSFPHIDPRTGKITEYYMGNAEGHT